MDENDAFNHFIRKLDEKLTIIFKWKIPNGQDLSNTDRDVMFVLFKMFYNGELDFMCKDPLIKHEVIQTELFKYIEQPVKKTDENNGTVFDYKPPQTTDTRLPDK